jgi:peptidoglycan hydrolase-like protein with peptidoglycan-binding domain
VTLGVAAGAVLMAAIASNAFYAQPGRHPHPLMATRGNATDGGASVEATSNDSALMAVPLVLEVQTALNEGGYYRAALDGKPGAATTAAIRAFQSERGLAIDGQPTPRLLSAIRAADAEEPVQMASRETAGDDSTGSVSTPAGADLVKRIQSGLAAAAVAPLKPDGVVGEQTRAAIRTFEALEGLDVTGEPNERILKRLIEIGALN